MAFILCSLVSGVIEKAYLGQNAYINSPVAGSTTGEPELIPVIQPFLDVQGTSLWDSLSNMATLGFKASTYQALWQMFMWQYAFFTPGYDLVQLILQCISVGIAISMVITSVSLLRGGGG